MLISHKSPLQKHRLRAKRTADVKSITVTVTSGKVFDGDEESQGRMARAVIAGEPGQVTRWKLADNQWADVTHEELREALQLAGGAQTTIWEHTG